jgi:UDP-2,3-diacylglucosamine pyrophosphatase LpxH
MDVPFDAVKKKVYSELADAMITGLDQAQIIPEEVQKSADYILRYLNEAKTEDDLLLILGELGSRWNIYNGVFLKYKTEQIKRRDQQKLQEVKSRLQQQLHV